jgi:hypothetical protein
MTKQNKWKKFVGEKPLILALASLLLVVALSFLIIQPQLSGRAAYQTQAVELAVGEVGLDPAVGLVKTAETFESTLKANLGASQATAIEAKILYPAEKVELVEVRSIQDTGIISGSAKWAELFKDIDISTSGEVHLRHAIIPEVTGGNPITGVVDLFVIEFRAKEIDEASETQIILEESRILYGDLNLVNSFKSADYSITVGEVCDNGIDDDGNGPIDCNDPACQGVGSCIITQFECPTTCGYSAECCQAVAGCDLYQGQCLGVATSCANMQATSRDELACAEPCIFIEDAVTSARNVCLTPTELDCQNEVDDDGDGRLDCSDRDCFANSLCAQSDDDEDGITNLNDNCPYTVTDTQNDNDQDGLGDGCDLDDDNDGIADSVDNCPLTANSGQLDSDGDGLGDSCDEDNTNGPGGDIDADGVLNSEDNCPNDANPGQEDSDNDGTPDACGDDDDDNDLIMDNADNCPMVANSGIDFSKNVAVNTFNSDGAINTGDILSTLSTGSFEINEVGNSIRFKYRTLADTYSIRFIVEDHNYPQLNLEFNNIRYSKSHGSICVSATECGLAPSEEWFEYEFKIQEKLGDSSYWIKQIIRVESLTNIEIDDLIVFTPSQEISQKDTDGDGLGDACDANLGCSEDRNCPFKQTCQEGECKLAPAEILCADRVDNDHDGWWDCADSDCSDSSQCAVGSFCSIDATNDVYSCERRVNAVAGGTDYDSLTDGYSCEGVYSGVPLMKSISGFSYLESNAGTLEIKDDWPQICRGATTLGARRNCLLNHGSLFNLHESTCYLDSEVSCSNGIDENANGLYDCAEPSCVGELNGNGATCCQIESDCGAVQECSNNICIAKVEILCTDNLDNDGDGLSDCQDSDCARDLSCSDICLAKDSE